MINTNKSRKLSAPCLFIAILLSNPAWASQVDESIVRAETIEAEKTETEESKSKTEQEANKSENTPVKLTKAQQLELDQLKTSLKLQYAQLRKVLDEHSPYSMLLAEEYLSYGLLLRKLSQYAEAEDAFINAIHINKVNHGIYSAKQLPPLRELFFTFYQQGDYEESEDTLARILWVEKQDASQVSQNVTVDESREAPQQTGLYYELGMQIIHGYIDKFLRNPSSAESSIEYLLRAKHHIRGIFSRYKDRGLDELDMPYGEMALVSFYQDQLHPGVDKTLSLRDPLLLLSRNLQSSNLRASDSGLASYMIDAYPKGFASLKRYLKKAEKTLDLHHIVRANIMLGDFQLLFDKIASSKSYYQEAWQQAQNLPETDTLANSFSELVPLPAFEFSKDRVEVLPDKPSVLIPVTLRVDKFGRVSGVHKFEKTSKYRRYYSRAKFTVGKIRFRPRIVDGVAQQTDNVAYEVRVLARRKKAEYETF